jgi:hypothetical protein
MVSSILVSVGAGIYITFIGPLRNILTLEPVRHPRSDPRVLLAVVICAALAGAVFVIFNLIPTKCPNPECGGKTYMSDYDDLVYLCDKCGARLRVFKKKKKKKRR